MATLKDILRQIGAVKKTKQITRAMNMVAASRLRGAQGKMESFEPYASKFVEVLGNLASGIEKDIHPLLIKKENVSRIELLHFSGDRGLCGSFNTNLVARAEKWIKAQQANGLQCSMTTVGKKGRDYFKKRNIKMVESHVNIYGNVDISFINTMTSAFINRYMADEVDEVYMMYSRFVSMARQEPTLVKLIPIEPPKAEDGEGKSAADDYLYEPGPAELLIELLPKNISVQILNAFLQNETSEHAARMAAMDNASKNCSELIESLTLAYNKARQAAITAELTDIAGGAEALKKA
jgi:F-type H+-transporting ATPase subunit gamma